MLHDKIVLDNKKWLTSVLPIVVAGIPLLLYSLEVSTVPTVATQLKAINTETRVTNTNYSTSL